MWKTIKPDQIPAPELPIDIQCEVLPLTLHGVCSNCGGRLIEGVSTDYPPRSINCGGCFISGRGMTMREAYVDLIQKNYKRSK